MKLIDISLPLIFHYSLLFCRVASSFIIAPGIGEIMIPMKIKLALGLAITYFVGGNIKSFMPMPESSIELVLIFFSEISIGVTFGIAARIFFSALYNAGHAIASSIGFSAAVIFDPANHDQSSVIGNLLGIFAVVVLVSTDLHLVMIDSLIKSYDKLPVGSFFSNYENFMDLITRVTVIAWNTGVRIAAPFIIISLLLNLGNGILSRLMPQLQVFFLILPAQVLVGLAILIFFVPAVVMWFIEEYKNFIIESLRF